MHADFLDDARLDLVPHILCYLTLTCHQLVVLRPVTPQCPLQLLIRALLLWEKSQVRDLVWPALQVAWCRLVTIDATHVGWELRSSSLHVVNLDVI